MRRLRRLWPALALIVVSGLGIAFGAYLPKTPQVDAETFAWFGLLGGVCWAVYGWLR